MLKVTSLDNIHYTRIPRNFLRSEIQSRVTQHNFLLPQRRLGAETNVDTMDVIRALCLSILPCFNATICQTGMRGSLLSRPPF